MSICELEDGGGRGEGGREGGREGGGRREGRREGGEGREGQREGGREETEKQSVCVSRSKVSLLT